MITPTSRLTREEIAAMKQSGRTYKEIAVLNGTSRQRVQQLLTPQGNKRLDLLKECGNLCQRCGKPERFLATHHESYLPEKLLVLCPTCHRIAHGADPDCTTRKKKRREKRLCLLTRRQEQLLRLLMFGLSNRQISDRLAISCKTVEKHRTRLFKSMEVHCAVTAVVKGIQLGILSVEVEKNIQT